MIWWKNASLPSRIEVEPKNSTVKLRPDAITRPTNPFVDETYKHAWLRGLKTTYYLRTLAKTSAEKSTGKGGELNAVSAHGGGMTHDAAKTVPAVEAKFCSIDNPDCEACQ